MSVITVVSVIGVAVGVLMMIVVRAVMLGFEADFRETLMGTKPHVLLRQEAGQDGGGGKGPAWQGVLEQMKAKAGVVSATPFAGGELYAANGDRQTVVKPVLGIPAAEAQGYMRKLTPHLLAGSLDMPDGTIVLTDRHLQDLELSPGDEVSVYAGPNVNEAVRSYSDANDEDDDKKRQAMIDKISLHPQKLTISGVLQSDQLGFAGYVSLRTGQALFQLGGNVTGIAIELAEPQRAGEIAPMLLKDVPGWTAELWSDEDKARLAAMQNEQTMMQLVLFIIALVAAFSVMNVTITVTTQKRHEIGMLAALGCTRGQITNVFLLQATIVGVLGTASGLGGSMLVLWLRNDLRQWLAVLTGGQVHAVEGVFLSTIPAHVDPEHVMWTCGISILLCIVAGWLPAWFAARMEPAEALRD
ncbi:ABC transporter permease [Brevifollis gellanilyticus]|uniref:ABC transporter permease n=1 Tax=Brevifollis gellanilyticus TaxID=748831 RepID=UPI001478C799|nr:FtsX-like permease family protein [Brevifollis gellanilyticus]